MRLNYDGKNPFLPPGESLCLYAVLAVSHIAHYGQHDASTKPEVHNIIQVVHCRQRRTEPRPQVTCTENVVKFGHVVFETYEQTDSHADTLIAISNKNKASISALHPYDARA